MLVRIAGQAPLTATVYSLERMRCGACGQVFTAQEPEGVGPEKIRRDRGSDDRANSRMAAEPRSIGWNNSVGFSAISPLKPARDELIRQAAQGEVVHNDDTSMRVLHLTREPFDERSGVFISGIVSTSQGWKIAIYFTGRQHAGENPADALQQRTRHLGLPIQMCDALSRNVPEVI